eukprot:6460988-Amphidinium_carterae.3
MLTALDKREPRELKTKTTRALGPACAPPPKSESAASKSQEIETLPSNPEQRAQTISLRVKKSFP